MNVRQAIADTNGAYCLWWYSATGWHEIEEAISSIKEYIIYTHMQPHQTLTDGTEEEFNICMYMYGRVQHIHVYATNTTIERRNKVMVTFLVVS